MRGRHRAHAQIELLALHPQHDPPVLRQPALGDVEPAMILMRDDRRSGQVGRRAFAFLEHAVDAVAHLQPVLERFDVDIRCAQFHRALDHQVHQPDDRRFRGEVAQVLDIVEAFLALGVLDDAVHRAAALAMPALDQFVDLAAHRHRRPRLAAGRQAHRIQHVRILRIGQQHVDVSGISAYRHDVELLHEADAQRDVLRRQLGHVPGTAQRQVEFGRAGLGVVAFGHQAQPAQQRQQAATVLLLQAARADQVGILQFAALQQQGGHALVGAGSRVVQGGIHGVGTAAAGRLRG
jgi:hypothetical protein